MDKQLLWFEMDQRGCTSGRVVIEKNKDSTKCQTNRSDQISHDDTTAAEEYYLSLKETSVGFSQFGALSPTKQNQLAFEAKQEDETCTVLR